MNANQCYIDILSIYKAQTIFGSVGMAIEKMYIVYVFKRGGILGIDKREITKPNPYT